MIFYTELKFAFQTQLLGWRATWWSWI